MNAPVLRAADLCFSRENSRVVLDRCGIELQDGDRVGLVGANGSGKTTLLWVLMGLLTPSSGTIEILGERRRTERDFQQVRGRIGLLFQDADDQLFCPTVAEDVAFGPLNQGKSQAESAVIVAETLQRLGLAGFEMRSAHHLSGGEKRLAALASVLSMSPEILLLDEPTAGLDDDSIERVADVLASLPQTLLIVSHDHAFLDRLTTRTLTMAEGRIS